MSKKEIDIDKERGKVQQKLDKLVEDIDLLSIKEGEEEVAYKELITLNHQEMRIMHKEKDNMKERLLYLDELEEQI